MKRWLRVVVICVCIASPCSAATSAHFNGKATAKDGDDLIIAGTDLRLFGIDAFERSQRCEAGGVLYACGEQAYKALATKIAGKLVDCTQRDYDTVHHRPVVVCSIDNEDLNA